MPPASFVPRRDWQRRSKKTRRCAPGQVSRGYRTWTVACLLAAFLPLAIPAQVKGNGQADDARQRVYFSALNQEEKPVLGLTERDFALRLNGRPAGLDDFQPGLLYTNKSIPLVVWILIDFNPNIDANVIARQARAGAEIFALVHVNSAVGVKLVSDRAETLAPLGHDPSALARAFVQFSQRRNELRAGGAGDTEVVGTAGMLRAIELAINEMNSFIGSQPSLRDRELHRAIMILSDGNISPSYDKKPLYEKAARDAVFFYPVFIPRSRYGLWVEYYFDLAKRTAGVASVLGALHPGSKILPLPRSYSSANALTLNFIHMIRDLNGKYSFAVSRPPAGEIKLDLKSRTKGVQLRVPRRNVP